MRSERVLVMKKRSLKDVKKANRQLIIQLILSNENMSRIELSNQTGLSPSTVSSLVSELLDQGILVENGVRVVTAGRSRTELQINPQLGIVAVAEIGRNSAELYLYDMALKSSHKEVIANTYMAGNELLIGITSAIFRVVGDEALHTGKLKGMGLLFQEDMIASEFNVMYSTGFASATISLREALVTQFHIPVTEEYSQTYTVRQVLEKEQDDTSKNQAHITIGSRVVVDVTQNGNTIALRNGLSADVTSLFAAEGDRADVRQLLESCTQLQKTQGEIGNVKGMLEPLTLKLTRMIETLCTLFSLDVVFIIGKIAHTASFEAMLTKRVEQSLPPDDRPKIIVLQQADQGAAKLMAGNLRQNLLCGDMQA